MCFVSENDLPLLLSAYGWLYVCAQGLQVEEGGQHLMCFFVKDNFVCVCVCVCVHARFASGRRWSTLNVFLCEGQVCVCVCVCKVCERKMVVNSVCIVFVKDRCVCVCVCERERARLSV